MVDVCLDFRKAFDVISQSTLASKLGHGSLDGWPPREVIWARNLPGGQLQEEFLQRLGMGEKRAMGR